MGDKPGDVNGSRENLNLLADDATAPEGRLWELCRTDVELLCGGPHNLGGLYLLPEVRAERFAGFHAVRAELKDAYRQLLAGTGRITLESCRGIPALSARSASARFIASPRIRICGGP